MNPLYEKQIISLRAQNHETSVLKVNDKLGNPIQVAAICVWKVWDTYRAKFEVEEYERFVGVQVEAALRKLVGTFSYDNFESEAEENTLRQSGALVN